MKPVRKSSSQRGTQKRATLEFPLSRKTNFLNSENSGRLKQDFIGGISVLCPEIDQPRNTSEERGQSQNIKRRMMQKDGGLSRLIGGAKPSAASCFV